MDVHTCMGCGRVTASATNYCQECEHRCEPSRIVELRAFHELVFLAALSGTILNVYEENEDLISWTPVTITQEHVGKTLAVFTSVECKGRSTPVRPEQIKEAHMVGWARLLAAEAIRQHAAIMAERDAAIEAAMKGGEA